MKFSKEKNALAELMNYLTDRSDKLQFAALKQNGAIYPEGEKKELTKRFDYLKYGFESRTRSVLENMYPQTKSALTKEKWMQYGSQYSHTKSRHYSNINEAGKGFPEFLQMRKAHSFAIDCAKLELAFYLSAIRESGIPLSKENFETINENSRLKLRPTVQVYIGKVNIDSNPWNKSKSKIYYLIFREEERIRTIPMQRKIANLFLLLGPNALLFSKLYDATKSEKSIIEFLTICMKYNLLENFESAE